jgi:RNase adapter protein RapZ
VAFGCTGGQHRSVAIAEAVAARWGESGRTPVSVWHRELERE